MNRLILLLLFTISLISCTQWSRAPSSRFLESSTKHVVFDIDWTITSEVGPKFNGKRIIEVEGKKYFVHLGLEDFVENLLSKEDVKVSFFSGGSRARNLDLLSKIKLSNGKSLADIAYKVFGKEDLKVIAGVDPKERFSKRFKKDLRLISKDLDQLIMIDDTQNFVFREADNEHVVYTGKTFQHFEKFADSITESGEYIPKTVSEWSFAQKKLMILNGAIDLAYVESKNQGISFSEAVKNQEKLLDLNRGDWNDHSRAMLYRSTLIPPVAESCKTLLIPFFKL